MIRTTLHVNASNASNASNVPNAINKHVIPIRYNNSLDRRALLIQKVNEIRKVIRYKCEDDELEPLL